MEGNFIKTLPQQFVRNTIGLCGDSGKAWLNDLPKVIEEISNRWLLKAEKPFPNLSYNYVAPCVCDDGSDAVLKITLPLDNPEIFSEANFLQMSGGAGIVKLLNSDKERRAMLLEKLSPGKNLKETYPDDESKTVDIAIDSIRKILKDPPKDLTFLKLEDWFNGFKRAENTEFPREFISRTLGFFNKSNAGSNNKFLIHGDLHHENILSAAREPFLVIDPKGVIGDVGYEIAVFLNNHLWWLNDQPHLKENLNYAVQRFSDAFKISPEDLRKWAFAQIVLSAWWTFEENNENWKKELAFAQNWEV